MRSRLWSLTPSDFTEQRSAAGARGGIRTRTLPREPRGLSPLRLPIPPPGPASTASAAADAILLAPRPSRHLDRSTTRVSLREPGAFRRSGGLVQRVRRARCLPGLAVGRCRCTAWCRTCRGHADTADHVVGALDRAPQLVSGCARRFGAQLVADHDPLDGVGDNRTKWTAAHTHSDHAIVGRPALDRAVKLVGTRRALEARDVQVQVAGGSSERSHGQDEAARRIEAGAPGAPLVARRRGSPAV